MTFRKQLRAGVVSRRISSGVVVALGLLISSIGLANAQTTAEAAGAMSIAALVQPEMSDASSSVLPDAPEAALPEAGALAGQASITKSVGPPVAGRYTKYIQPGQTAPKLSIGDKFVLGAKDAFGPLSAVGWAVSAGYAQAVDGSPNYGVIGNTQTGKAFAQRLGAAAARASSEGLFSDSILSPILHEDPRYYKMGNGHNFVKRLVYAGTRTLITRTDGGHLTPNFALLGGNLAGSALTQAYYPPVNQGFDQVLQTFGGSIGGSALGFVVSEFLSDTLRGLHITK